MPETSTSSLRHADAIVTAVERGHRMTSEARHALIAAIVEDLDRDLATARELEAASLKTT